MSDYQIFIGQYGNPTHGAWVDATDVDACDAAIKLYSRDGAIDVGAMDSEGFDGLVNTESISTLRAIAEYLDGRDDAAARLAYAAHVGETNPSDLDTQFDDAYQGEWSDEETFVEETFREIYSIPKELEYYIDFKKMARDWFISDFFSVSGGRGVYVFRNI